MRAKEFEIKKRDPNWRAMQDIRRSGAGGQHKDKKKAAKQGDVKHKGRMAEGDYPDGSSLKTPSPEEWQKEYEKAKMAVKNAKSQQEYEAASDRAGRIKDLLASKGIKVGPVLGNEGMAEGTVDTEKQILTRIRQIMYDRKLSGTDSNAGELLRLKQKLKDIRNKQGVSEGDEPDEEYLDKVISDLHKDALGFRPDREFGQEWMSSSFEEKLEIYNNLLKSLNSDIDEGRRDYGYDSFGNSLRPGSDEGSTEPPNNFAIYINGKKWKVFQGKGQYADDQYEMQQFRQLQAMAARKSQETGKKWEVVRTGEPATK